MEWKKWLLLKGYSTQCWNVSWKSIVERQGCFQGPGFTVDGMGNVGLMMCLIPTFYLYFYEYNHVIFMTLSMNGGVQIILDRWADPLPALSPAQEICAWALHLFSWFGQAQSLGKQWVLLIIFIIYSWSRHLKIANQTSHSPSQNLPARHIHNKGKGGVKLEVS